MALIEQRHPVFAQLMALWRLQSTDASPPLASAIVPALVDGLARATVLLGGDIDKALTIRVSGSEVDALYGTRLEGAPAARLSPQRGDAEQEARTVIETGRPLLIEDELRQSGTGYRVARLYLPLACDEGSAERVVCGVVALT